MPSLEPRSRRLRLSAVFSTFFHTEVPQQARDFPKSHAWVFLGGRGGVQTLEIRLKLWRKWRYQLSQSAPPEDHVYVGL